MTEKAKDLLGSLLVSAVESPDSLPNAHIFQPFYSHPRDNSRRSFGCTSGTALAQSDLRQQFIRGFSWSEAALTAPPRFQSCFPEQ